MTESDRTVRTITAMWRKEGMTHEEFNRYWLEVHAPIVARMPGIARYAQRHIVPSGEPDTSGIDGYVLLEYATQEDMDAAWASPEGAAAMADAAKFTSRRERVYYSDHVIVE